MHSRSVMPARPPASTVFATCPAAAPPLIPGVGMCPLGIIWCRLFMCPWCSHQAVRDCQTTVHQLQATVQQLQATVDQLQREHRSLQDEHSVMRAQHSLLADKTDGHAVLLNKAVHCNNTVVASCMRLTGLARQIERVGPEQLHQHIRSLVPTSQLREHIIPPQTSAARSPIPVRHGRAGQQVGEPRSAEALASQSQSHGPPRLASAALAHPDGPPTPDSASPSPAHFPISCKRPRAPSPASDLPRTIGVKWLRNS